MNAVHQRLPNAISSVVEVGRVDGMKLLGHAGDQRGELGRVAELIAQAAERSS